MNKLNQLLEKFEIHSTRLAEAILMAKSELEQDGVLQRFEFTFELCWKTLKVFLEQEGVACNSPKSCLKEAYKVNLLQDEQLWLKILDDRNASTHIYDSEMSDEIFDRIKDRYCLAFKEVLNTIKTRK